jgi:hypothetical protein
MKRIFVAVVLMLLLVSSANRAEAGNRKLFARSAVINSRTGMPIPVTTRLQPVIGSVQRTSHFANPFTHKARYTSTVYNPVLGTFGNYKFRR